MSPTKPCPCGTAREHLGNGVYKCFACGHIWDTWNWCAPRGGWNEEIAELVRQASRPWIEEGGEEEEDD